MSRTSAAEIRSTLLVEAKAMMRKMRLGKLAARRGRLAIVAMVLLLPCGHAEAFVYKLLHSFHGADGAWPSGGLILDTDGSFYGVTAHGSGTGCGGMGCGAVFEMTPKGKETILYRFKAGPYGSNPLGRLIRDDVGNLYGVTQEGGSTACGDPDGCGTIFKLSPDGVHTVLHAFTGGISDGWGANGNLVLDSAGNLYGTTGSGGGTGCTNSWGCGTVYRLAPDRSITMLYTFKGGSDGAQPTAGLLRDGIGNLYGTTISGGDTSCYRSGCGVVFELPAAGGEKILHTFRTGEGSFPVTGLTRDSAGDLYGGTGFSYDMTTLFQLSPSGTFQTLLHFRWGDANGVFPGGEVLRDAQGDLFLNNQLGGSGGDGAVFKLAADGTASAVHEFGAWPQDGVEPVGTPVMVHGKLYGVTRIGGLYDKGAVWVLAL